MHLAIRIGNRRSANAATFFVLTRETGEGSVQVDGHGRPERRGFHCRSRQTIPLNVAKFLTEIKTDCEAGRGLGLRLRRRPRDRARVGKRGQGPLDLVAQLLKRRR